MMMYQICQNNEEHDNACRIYQSVLYNSELIEVVIIFHQLPFYMT